MGYLAIQEMDTYTEEHQWTTSDLFDNEDRDESGH